jgi:hypothetical protein
MVLFFLACQLGWAADLEVRSWFQGKGQGKQDVVIDAKVGLPLLIRQEKVEESWRAWVAVFSAQGVEQMVKEAQ